MTGEAPEQYYFPTFLAKQPIFDKQERVWGYELLFRDSAGADFADFTDTDKATLDVAAGAMVSWERILDKTKKVCINFPQKSILDNVPYALPSSQTVVEIAERSLADPEIAQALKSLKLAGYMVAIDGFEGRDTVTAFLGLADVIIVDVLGKKWERVEELLRKAQNHCSLVEAKRIEDQEQFSKAKELGFSLFQGYFFKKPEMISGRKLTAHSASRFRLLKLIEEEDPEVSVISQDLQSDVSISYRLLTFLNSAAFGFPQKITSIKQAIVLLGWKQLRNWLRVIILTDLMPEKKTAELAYLAVQRGRFLQLAAQEVKGWSPDALFLLGLFSLLEPMLDLSMAEVVEHLPLEEDLKKALCREDVRDRIWLDIVDCFEAGDWEALDPLAESLGLPSIKISIRYYESIVWAGEYFQRDN
jgi:c-di-GMP phosphodiesterase